MNKNIKENEMKYFNFKKEPGLEKSTRKSILTNSIPNVTIITTYKNEKEYLKQFYLSLRNQTLPNWEWIITKCDSTKRKDNNLKRIAKLDSRIKIIYTNDETKSISKAKSNLICFMNIKDLIDKTLLECAYFSFHFNKEIDWAFSDFVEFGKKELLYSDSSKLSIKNKIEYIPNTIFIKKDILLNFKEYNNYTEHYTLIKLLLENNYSFIKLNYYATWIRLLKRSNSINSKVKKNTNKDIYKIKNLNQIILDTKHNIEYSDTPSKFVLDPKIKFNNEIGKKILFILPCLNIGGADIFNFNLIKGLKNRGYQISVISTNKCDYRLRSLAEEFADEYFDLTTFLKKKDWASFIYHIMYSRKIDLVFLTNSYYGYYCLPWLKCQFPNVPFVDYIHAENLTLRNGGYPKDSNAVAGFLDKTYTCTKHLKNIMYEEMNRHKRNIKVLYIGTNHRYYDPSLKEIIDEKLASKFKNKKIILFPTRIVHYKRPLFAIKVLEKLLSIRKDVVLLIVGNGAAFKDVKKYIKDNKLSEYVYCTGMVKDTRKYYKIADITLITSLREGLTLTTYESLAMGIPVITSDVGGQKEVINDKIGKVIEAYQKPFDEFNFKYSKEEINKYVNSINDILNVKSKKLLNKKCRNIIEKKYNFETIVKELDKDITNLIYSGSKVRKANCKNIEFAERFLIVHSKLENKE